ncbi:MAG: dockerin type I repeat-containing protein [Clostridia bacterium]|nr:dockerin type I repeat-containing protein [Clostridia bacterium]
MKRRVLSVIVSLFMIIGAVYPGLTVAGAAVWSGTAVIPSLSGDVYQIATAENLAWFAQAVNSGTSSIKAELTADIELNTLGSRANEWTPIGTMENPFTGTFDGAGHTISGVYINQPEMLGVGLFGVVKNTNDEGKTASVAPEFIVAKKTYLIKNLRVTGADINGYQNVGGIVGHSVGAGIKDCYFEGQVNGGYNSVGGVVGLADAETVLNQCYAASTVVGKQRTGGVVGYASSNSVISKCYATVDVTGTMYVGGIVGTLGGANLVGCFVFGTVSGNNRVGGLIGYSTVSVVRGAYTFTKINSTGTYLGGAVGYIYGGEYSNIFYCYEQSLCDGPVGVARTQEEMYTSDFVRELNKAMPYFCFDYTEINNGYPVLTWMLQTDVWTGELEIPSQNESGIYLIYKPSELAWFAGLVNGTIAGVEANPAANAKVMSDLLFNINVYDDSMGIREWTPIGTPSKPYTGSFNGGEKNIAGLYTTTSATEDGKYVGLFGYVGQGAKIDYTLVMDGLICGTENVGGIAGYAIGAQITNSVCASEVRGDRAVGGVAGNIAGSTVVSSCGMIGSINGTNTINDKSQLMNIGGVVGYNNRSTINKSFSYSDISAADARYVGGLIGNNVGGTLTNSYSTSTVTGGTNAGGIVGYNNNGTVTTCYTAGKVTAASGSGIAFGQNAGAGVSNCIYDSSYVTLSNTIAGAAAKTTEEMTATRAIDSLKLSTGDWRFLNDDEYFYYYPQLISMAFSASRTIRSTSLESVKRVQPKYVARVEIDGRIDTYYQTIKEALDYASATQSTVLPTVYIVRDYELNETLNIASTVGLFGENGAVLRRASDFKEAMLNVTGKLTIGSDIYGYDDSPSFFIDGNGVEGTESGIVVQKYGILNIASGAEIRNFRTVSLATATVRGAAVKVLGGELNMNGGIFRENISKTTGGAIYSEDGTVTVTGGTFRDCEATQGAAIYNNDGTATITGGNFIANIASSNGGAVATNGLYAKTVISNKANFEGNQATNGGALSTAYYAKLEISGGSFNENVAYDAGGAIYIDIATTVTLSGGSFTGNVSNHSKGGAVYNKGSLVMMTDAQLDTTNDVYLTAGTCVTVNDRLNCSGYAAIITPENYSEGLQIIDGEALGTGYSKFGLTNTNWYLLANGKMTSLDSKTVAIVSKDNAYSVQFPTLYDAFESVKAGEVANITVVADNTVTKPITVYGDITLTCDEVSYVSMRGGAHFGIMFDVAQGGVLRIGDIVENVDQQAQNDYLTGERTAGQVILDGGAGHTGVVGAAAINVRAGGELYLNDDAVIQNFTNKTTSTITVSGTMYMYGGAICNNASCYGGAILVNSAGTVNLAGGAIYDNTSEKGAEAIYSEGRLVRNIHSYNYYFMEHIYDSEGNYVETKDPIYYSTIKTDVLIKKDDRSYLANNRIYTQESESDFLVTSTSDVPDQDDFSMYPMTLDLAAYNVGAVVLSGTKVSTYYTGFGLAKSGYYLQGGGTLGLNGLIPKSTSTLIVNGENSTISGFDLADASVGKYLQQFENDRSKIRFYTAEGRTMTNAALVTTGCYIQLRDESNKVIDTVTIVIYGDLNSDYIIDGQDSVLINAVAEGLLNSDNASAAVLEAADVNFDGMVTSIDAQHTDMSGLFLQTIGQIRK